MSENHWYKWCQRITLVQFSDVRESLVCQRITDITLFPFLNKYGIMSENHWYKVMSENNWCTWCQRITVHQANHCAQWFSSLVQCTSCCCYFCWLYTLYCYSMVLHFCWSLYWLNNFPTSSWCTLLLLLVCSSYVSRYHLVSYQFSE